MLFRLPPRSLLTAMLALALCSVPLSALANDFDDRDAIVEMALADDAEARSAAEQTLSDANDELATAMSDLATAEQNLQDAIDTGAAQGDIDALQLLVDDASSSLTTAQGSQATAQSVVDVFDAEDQAVVDAVAAMSDEQVVAFNRSVNDTSHNGRQLNLDAEYLQLIVDGNYDGRQIQSLTKALEEEAKFLAFAARATDRYDATGNNNALDQAARFEALGDAQKQKFLGRIDARNEARDARAVARDARAAARDAAHDAAAQARDAARDARDAARNAARDARRG